MKQALLIMLFNLAIITGMAQSPGIIVRPAAGNGVTPLNPNGDGFSSATTSGFATSDITESEIPYKTVPPAILEPTSDLMRGPAELYSDLVRQVDGSGFYVYNDGSNLLFRLRIGSIVSGSKGYSVLIDTDGKMGNTGAYADPNYQAATTGVNGNPGFELEIVLETNFRVAAYNVDGTSSPTLINSYGINSNAQVSVALSTVSSTPDYFYDFYVPISALGITASTPLRMTATTVMAPTAAIGGPKSDIYGVNDASYNDPMKSWEVAINNTPSITLTNIASSGSGVGATCTAAPTVTSPVQAGSGITVTGSWTSLDVSKPSTATITLYKNGVSAGTTTVATGNTWSINGITVSNGDVLYAKAQATGESMCLQSNSVQVVSCSAANTTSTGILTYTCLTRKGVSGTRPANASVRLYTVTTSGITLLADDNSTTYRIFYPTSTTWGYDGANGGGVDPCTSASNDINDGSYAVTAQETSKCESGPVFSCLNFTQASTPAISQTNLYSSSTVVSGNVASGSGATVRLYINAKLQTTATADGSGNYSFSNLVLSLSDVVNVVAQASGGCVSAAASRTVMCFTTPPVITTDNNGNLSTGSTTIAGKSGEPAGTVVTVYENGVSIGTTTVQSNGTWSITYTPIATRSYTATQQNGSCAASAASTAASALAATTVCPSITGSYTAAATSVTGSLPVAFTGTIRLYLDGTSIGSTSVTSATAWTISGLNSTYSNTLYAGGVLTVTSQATSAAEKIDCSSSVTLSCATPTTPVITPTSASIQTGQTVTYNLNTTQSGIIYALTDATTGTTNYAVSKWGTGSSLSLPTNTFNSVGSYNVLVKAVSLSGAGCLSTAAASITVSAVLPVTLSYFTGRYVDGQSQLTWETIMEEQVDHFAIERSEDGQQYREIGTVAATGNSTSRIKYNYTDNNPVVNNVWYRLRTVDTDGKWRYSNVIRIANTTGNVSVLSVAPNPFESLIRVKVYSGKVLPVAIRMIDMTGREIYKTNRILSAGNNTISLNPSAALAKGMYLLQVIAGNEVVWNQRIQKAK
ncbi:T9SS type A sorting domain-containing protein [Niastella caeni]|uniref:T9SS type A sorting domain-containing protein n=1 Tax=Niastella caeni TaxID=2569763 RepID=A0A4S8HKV6_9BACT|nr:T9SS type A sorting domain-containing protein [Niastella caeni]THU33512.1 T9SS type A sorting domain-containing protein [Niastella caeni]